MRSKANERRGNRIRRNLSRCATTHRRATRMAGRPSVRATFGGCARVVDSEGAPVAFLEACAMGLPAVATRHVEIPDVVIERVTGLLCDERDVSKMAENLINLALIQTSQPRWVRMLDGISEASIGWTKASDA